LKDPEWLKPCRDARIPDRLLDCAGKHLPRVLGNSRRRQKAEPDAEEIILIAEIAHRRNGGELGKATRRNNAAKGL